MAITIEVLHIVNAINTSLAPPATNRAIANTIVKNPITLEKEQLLS